VAAYRPALARDDMDGGHWEAQDAPKGYVDFMTFPDAKGTERPIRRVEELLAILAGL
jgi:hypothetical protein